MLPIPITMQKYSLLHLPPIHCHPHWPKCPTQNTIPLQKELVPAVTAAQVQLSYDATDASGPGVSVADKSLIRVTKDNGS
jgi:hypothetical protein